MADTSPPDINTFVDLSVTLTQFDKKLIAPFADKINLKQQYLDRLVKEMGAEKVNALFQEYNRLKALTPQTLDSVCDALINPASTSGLAGDFSFMAKSILKMWYLGAWFPPESAVAPKKVAATERGAPSTSPKAYQVISADAYVRGFAWRAMQAHPMGYSDFTFGYWAEEPPALAEFLPLDGVKG
jgi:hypothetical protein